MNMRKSSHRRKTSPRSTTPPLDGDSPAALRDLFNQLKAREPSSASVAKGATRITERIEGIVVQEQRPIACEPQQSSPRQRTPSPNELLERFSKLL